MRIKYLAKLNDIQRNKLNGAPIGKLLDWDRREEHKTPYHFVGIYNPITNGHGEFIPGLREWLNRQLNISPYINILDNSIWHRYSEFDNVHRQAEISAYFNFIRSSGIYDTPSATEYLDFQVRVLPNNHLETSDVDGHGTYLIPIEYHSESKMLQFIIQKRLHAGGILQHLSQGRICEWKILLVDDNDKKLEIICNWLSLFGEVRLRRPDNTVEEFMLKPEVAAISDELKVKINPNNNTFAFEITRTTTVNQGIQALTNRGMFDIVMLDYLLEKTSDRTRGFGHHFLKRLNDILSREHSRSMKEEEVRLVNAKGPFGRFWIFPVSSHNAAMLDHFRMEDIPHLNNNWFISQGADPINTPYLFLHNLFVMMELQLKEAVFEKKEMTTFLDQLLPPDTENRVYKWSMFESKAKALLNEFILRFGTLELLEHGMENGSLLCRSIHVYMQKDQANAVANRATSPVQYGEVVSLYDAIRHFLYLLGYRSYSDFQELLHAFYRIQDNLPVNELQVLERVLTGRYKNEA